jgi:hypothetical protein
MARLALRSVLAAVVLAGCGGGGGGGGGFAFGPTDWGVPFMPSSGSQTLGLTLQNLSTHARFATVSWFADDGTLLEGPDTVDLDGLGAITGFFGGTDGGWVHVETPSRDVEVGFTRFESGASDEASRGWPLVDLSSPPPNTTASVSVFSVTREVQIVNASAAPALVNATGYRIDTGSGVSSFAITPIALAAHESLTLDPEALTGEVGFAGTVFFSSTQPIFAAALEQDDANEDVSFDGMPHTFTDDVVRFVVLRSGIDHLAPDAYTDASLVLRNDSDESRAVTIVKARLPDGTQLLGAPFAFPLEPHETHVIDSGETPLFDLFQIADRIVLQISVPRDVSVTGRQFDPDFFVHTATIPATPAGHVLDAIQVVVVPVLPDVRRNVFTLHNPNVVDATVGVFVIVPQPSGFDSFPQKIASVLVPAGGFVDYSPDGVEFLDRDLEPADEVDLRFTCPAPVALFGRREERTVPATGLLMTITAAIVRSHDDAD